MKILTITLNPAIDTKYEINSKVLKVGKVNRVLTKVETPGGKGLNVSRVLNQLNVDVLASGFLGGSKGTFIEASLDTLNISHDFQKCESETRTCLAIIDNEKNITEVLEAGKKIKNIEINLFIEKYKELIKNVEIIAMSGSLPKGLKPDFYKTLIDIANKENKKVILDTSGEALKEGIKANPYLIKPNIDELEFLLGKKLEDTNEAIEYSKILIKDGISNIMITLGGEGGLLINNERVIQAITPTIKVENTVGSGDSSIAGFIYGLSQNLSLEDCFINGLGAGTSNAMQQETGKIDLNDFKEIKNNIELNRL